MFHCLNIELYVWHSVQPPHGQSELIKALVYSVYRIFRITAFQIKKSMFLIKLIIKNICRHMLYISNERGPRTLHYTPDSGQTVTGLHLQHIERQVAISCYTYLLTELSLSWEAANCAALPSILWNPKVHHRVHKSPPLVPIMSQIDPVHTIPSSLSKIYFNNFHPPTSWSS
jgi:hypothetical protein